MEVGQRREEVGLLRVLPALGQRPGQADGKQCILAVGWDVVRHEQPLELRQGHDRGVVWERAQQLHQRRTVVRPQIREAHRRRHVVGNSRGKGTHSAGPSHIQDAVVLGSGTR